MQTAYTFWAIFVRKVGLDVREHSFTGTAFPEVREEGRIASYHTTTRTLDTRHGRSRSAKTTERKTYIRNAGREWVARRPSQAWGLVTSPYPDSMEASKRSLRSSPKASTRSRSGAPESASQRKPPRSRKREEMRRSARCYAPTSSKLFIWPCEGEADA